MGCSLRFILRKRYVRDVTTSQRHTKVVTSKLSNFITKHGLIRHHMNLCRDGICQFVHQTSLLQLVEFSKRATITRAFIFGPTFQCSPFYSSPILLIHASVSLVCISFKFLIYIFKPLLPYFTINSVTSWSPVKLPKIARTCPLTFSNRFSGGILNLSLTWWWSGDWTEANTMRRWQQISSGTCKVNTAMRNYTEISLLLTFYLIYSRSMVLNAAVSKLQRCHFRRRYRYFFYRRTS